MTNAVSTLAAMAVWFSLAGTARGALTNCDFEWGTFGGWSQTTNNCGGNSGGYFSINNRYANPTPVCTPGTTNWQVPCASFLPRVRPGSAGCFAAELYSGNGCSCGQSLLWVQIQQSFTASACGTLCFWWAAMIPDGHSCGQNAKVELTILANGTPVTNPPCGSIKSEATPSCQQGGIAMPLFACLSVVCGSGNPTMGWSYHPWQQCCINLAPFGGMIITIQGRATSCAATVHGAYLLLDDLCLLTCSPTVTVLPTATVTATSTSTATISGTSTSSGTSTRTATISETHSITETASITPTSTESGTPTLTATVSGTHTISETGSDTATATASGTATGTATSSGTPTVTRTASVTATASPTATFGTPFFVIHQNEVRAHEGQFGSVDYSFGMMESGTAILAIFNSAGEKVRVIKEEIEGRRRYDRFWDLRNERGDPVSSNVYVFRFRSGAFGAPVRRVGVLR